MDGIVISCPKKGEIGSSLCIPMSGRYSIRTAVKDTVPTARVVMDIIAPPTPQPARRSNLAALARSVSGLVMRNVM
eukprot:3629976-Rhodomonas_salina.1